MRQLGGSPTRAERGGGRGEGEGKRVGEWREVSHGGEPGLPEVLGVAGSAVEGSTGSD
jgi:hypothetical protein